MSKDTKYVKEISGGIIKISYTDWIGKNEYPESSCRTCKFCKLRHGYIHDFCELSYRYVVRKPTKPEWCIYNV